MGCPPPPCHARCWRERDELFDACIDAGDPPQVCEQAAEQFVNACLQQCDANQPPD
jgi:hypothetical protein